MTSETAFDPLAETYDDDFTHSQIGQYLRGRIHTRLLSHFSAGDHVLELGCGTGEDALFLAEHGIHITATDASDAMLDVARAKTQHNPLVDIQPLNLASLPDADFNTQFDGIISNFGALNCLTDWRTLAEWLSTRIRHGGTIGLGIMSPFCVWETLWHGAHLDFKTAFRRWRKNTTFGDITVRYPTIKRITQDFAPHFRRTHIEGIGIFLPPSDVYGVIEKRPRLLNTLTHLENRFGKHAKLALLADHYWVEFTTK